MRSLTSPPIILSYTVYTMGGYCRIGESDLKKKTRRDGNWITIIQRYDVGTRTCVQFRFTTQYFRLLLRYYLISGLLFHKKKKKMY